MKTSFAKKISMNIIIFLKSNSGFLKHIVTLVHLCVESIKHKTQKEG